MSAGVVSVGVDSVGVVSAGVVSGPSSGCSGVAVLPGTLVSTVSGDCSSVIGPDTSASYGSGIQAGTRGAGNSLHPVAPCSACGAALPCRK